MLRGSFAVRGKLRAARAYVTSHGLYELEVNGRRVGDERFTPGWTSYGKRLQYQTYDVTALLRTGDNAIGATLGDGWYRGYLAWRDRRNVFGERLALLCQLRIEYADGRVETVGTDDKWRAATGPILASDLYMGETYDARLEKPGWSAPGFADADWTPVRVVAEAPKHALVAPAGPPVRAIEEVKPVKILRTPAGETVFDMGQNMVGCVRLKVSGPAGTRVVLRHAEVLDKAGNFYTDNLRAAKQEVAYVLKGGGRRDVRAALLLPGLPLRRGRRLARRADARRADRGRRPLRHGGHGELRDLEPAAQSAPAQHPLGPEGQLPRRADGLPAARRAARLDGRRAGLLAHRELQHGRGRLLHEVAGRRGGRPEREGRSTPRRAERPEPHRRERPGRGRVPRRLRSVGRRRHDRALEHVPRLRRPPAPRAAVPEHEGVGRVPAPRGRRHEPVEERLPLRRLARLRDDRVRLPRRDHRQGPHRLRVLRALDGPAAEGRRRPREEGRRGVLRRAAAEDQGRVPPRVRDRRRPGRREHADGVRPGPPVRPAAGGDARRGRPPARDGGAHARPPHDRLRRDARTCATC